MNKELRHQFEQQFLLHGKVVLDMVVKHLEAFENFGVIVNLIEDSVLNLVVLDYAKN